MKIHASMQQNFKMTNTDSFYCKKHYEFFYMTMPYIATETNVHSQPCKLNGIKPKR